MSQAELARQLTEKLSRSYPRTTVNKMALGDREISGEELIAIAEILGIMPPSLDGAIAKEVVTSSEQLVSVAIAGKVEAGAFRTAPEFTDLEPEAMFEPRDPQFPWARQVAFEVGGDSMNRLHPRPILPGDRIICVDFDDLGGRVPIRDGMVVVVEQTADGGHLREWSVKQIELYEDRIEYHPRSTNPAHKPIVVPRDAEADDGRTVRILALVRRITNNVPF
ncbi:MAG: peptidase S24 [Beijerinckiaceae bacterium]|nr:peptidase S24 [Beijerinckiaceae bacterium]